MESIHIWYIELERFTSKKQSLIRVLSDEERQKAQQFRFAQDQQRYVISHGCCRLILSRYLHVPAPKIQFGVTTDGKPFVRRPKEPVVYFNLTHAGEMAAVAVSTKPVGIDIEQVDKSLPFEEVISQFMSDREQEIFHRISAKKKPIAFYCCWTRKEAYVKALGRGLTYPIRQVTVSLTDQQVEPWHDEYDPTEQDRWRMFHLDLLPGYLGAVVGQENQLIQFSTDKLLSWCLKK